MEFLENTYVAVAEFARDDGDDVERRNSYWSDRVKIKPAKPTSSGESSVMMIFPFEDESGENRTAVMTLGADIIESSHKIISQLNDLESRFSVLSENSPLRGFCEMIDEETDLSVLYPRETEYADLGAVDLLVPGVIDGEEFDIIITIGLNRTDWTWYSDTKVWIEYPISETKMEILQDKIIPYGERFEGPLDENEWSETWEYEVSSDEMEDSLDAIDWAFSSILN